MLLTINGQSQTFSSSHLDINTLLDQLSVDPKLVVIELNQSILSPEHYDNTPLNEGDVIELIQFVGGG